MRTNRYNQVFGTWVIEGLPQGAHIAASGAGSYDAYRRTASMLFDRYPHTRIKWVPCEETSAQPTAPCVYGHMYV